MSVVSKINKFLVSKVSTGMILQDVPRLGTSYKIPSWISGFAFGSMVVLLTIAYVDANSATPDPYFSNFVRGLLLFSTCVFSTTFSYQLSESFKDGSLYLLLFKRLSESTIIPGRSYRNSEINLRYNDHMRRFEPRSNPQNKIQEDLRKEIIEEFKKNPKSFVEKHFYPSQSLVRHYLEKALVDGMPNVAFIYNTLLIPKRKELPVECLKNLFYCFSHASSRALVPAKYYLDNSHVSKLFKKYSHPQITSLFSRPYSFTLYAELIQNNDNPLEVESTLGQVCDNVMLVDNVINPSILELDQKTINGLTVKVLRTKREYIRCGNTFGNCVRSNFVKENVTDYITFYQGQMPLVCAELGENLAIIEIKGVRNSVLSSSVINQVNKILQSQ